ncbi:MAG: hypothetical protein ACPHV3_06635 [Vibrio sp.]
MQNKPVQDIQVGGRIETALSGDYSLSPAKVIAESWRLTMKNFFAFTPSILILLLIIAAIFYIALTLQLGDLSALIPIIQSGDAEQLMPVMQAFIVANISYEVICAPIYAGICLMGMSHAVGIKTKPSQILRGLQFTLPIIIMTVIAMTIQGIAGIVLSLLSLYVAVALSQANLLICEKRMSPIQSMLMSFRAVNKKLFPIVALYFFMMTLLIASVLFSGIGLILTLPWFFHMKGVLYRDMFGVRLSVQTDRPLPDDVKVMQSSERSTDNKPTQTSSDDDTFDA